MDFPAKGSISDSKSLLYLSKKGDGQMCFTETNDRASVETIVFPVISDKHQYKKNIVVHLQENTFRISDLMQCVTCRFCI